MLDSDDKLVYFNGKLRKYSEYPESSEDLIRMSQIPWSEQKVFNEGDIIDESVYDFFAKHSGIKDRKNLNYYLDVLLDASIRSYYAAGAKEISARTCNITANSFQKQYKIQSAKPTYYYKSTNSESLSLYESLLNSGIKSLRFKGGWSKLNSSILSFLQSSGVSVINSQVASIKDSSRVLELSDGSFRSFDQIICSTNSRELSKMYPAMKFNIPHRTWTVLNIGYEKPPNLAGFGYAVPGVENSNLFAAIYNFNCFPENKPTVTLLGTGEHALVLKDFLSQTTSSYPDMGLSRILEDASPQYRVGHYLEQEQLVSTKPDWLHIAGHSFYHSGIPSCIIRSKEIVSNLL